MASTISLHIVQTPADQLDALAANPLNCFKKTAERIKHYIKTGKNLDKAALALYIFYDMKLMRTLSQKAPKDVQQSIQKKITSLIEQMGRSEESKGMNQYEVLEICVATEINALGNSIKAALRDIFDGVDKLFFFQDAQK